MKVTKKLNELYIDGVFINKHKTFMEQIIKSKTLKMPYTIRPEIRYNCVELTTGNTSTATDIPCYSISQIENLTKDDIINTIKELESAIDIHIEAIKEEEQQNFEFDYEF